jgi:hypothetical protein
MYEVYTQCRRFDDDFSGQFRILADSGWEVKIEEVRHEYGSGYDHYIRAVAIPPAIIKIEGPSPSDTDTGEDDDA